MNNCEYQGEDMDVHYEEFADQEMEAWTRYFEDYLEIQDIHAQREGDDTVGQTAVKKYVRDSGYTLSNTRTRELFRYLEDLRRDAMEEFHNAHCKYQRDEDADRYEAADRAYDDAVSA